MKRVLAALVVCLALSASQAFGAVFDAYVSNTGNDTTNTCNYNAPCATFASAFSQLAANGVIHVLNPGNYGNITITHGVTIDGGNMASNINGFSVPFAPTFQVTAGASDVVTIKNFTISGDNAYNLGSESSAIVVTSVGALHVEHCMFAGFNSAAISFQATGALLDMKDVTITDMANGTGVYVANARASLEHVSISRTQTAVISAGSSTVTVTHSTFNGNGEALAAAYGPTAEIHIDDCTMINNEWAVVVSQGASAYVSRSSLSNNVISALFNDGSSFLVSYGDNRFVSNAGDGAFTSTATTK